MLKSSHITTYRQVNACRRLRFIAPNVPQVYNRSRQSKIARPMCMLGNLEIRIGEHAFIEITQISHKVK